MRLAGPRPCDLPKASISSATFPLDRQIGAGSAGVAQRARLVLGPERQIDVVFLIGLQAPPAYLPNAGYSARSSSASVPSVGSAT